MKKVYIIIVIMILCCFTGCDSNNANIRADERRAVVTANELQQNQPSPTDIEYSLERYNLIRRAYWVNGMREKAVALPCEVTKPLGYITLFVGSSTLGTFTVDGKVSSLNSFLTPDYQYFSTNDSDSTYTLAVPRELADVDGSYGENDGGIFFFTTDGKYIEFTGDYLYSDIPMIVDNPVISFGKDE